MKNDSYDIKACVADILDLDEQRRQIQEQIKDRKLEAKDNGVNPKALNLALKLMREQRLARDMAYGEAQAILREVGAHPVDMELFENIKKEEGKIDG